MHCPRLKHFVRLNPEGKFSKCGHMINAPLFDSFVDMQTSAWLSDIAQKLDSNIWPDECVRCSVTENLNEGSVRLRTISRHNELLEHHPDYLIVGGVLDNICNSACQSCNSELSTKIASLEQGRSYIQINNVDLFNQLPLRQVVQLDINGGEPTASPNYLALLESLPETVKYVRLNTNASKLLPGIEKLLSKNIHLTVTISFDGVESVHDYVRWPIKWTTFIKTVESYKALSAKYPNLHLDLWTTIHALNVGDLDNIIQTAQSWDILWFFGVLETPSELSIQKTNLFTLAAKKKLSLSSNEICSKLCELIASENNNQFEIDKFINTQDSLRNINILQYNILKETSWQNHLT